MNSGVSPSRRRILQAMAITAVAALKRNQPAEAFVDPNVTFNGNNILNMWINGNYRHIQSNDIPAHPVGIFPDRGCPNVIQPQRFHFRMPLNPQENKTLKPLINRVIFGVGLDGVPFDPGTALFWRNQRESIWSYCLLTGHMHLGLDQSNAHVQPNGMYHYHGVPTELIRLRGGTDHICLIGYAADGFPMYGPWGYHHPHDHAGGVRLLKSSYRLKNGDRPNPPNGPGGKYDGTFAGDFEYVEGLGDLDQANGRHGVTPEYPQGTFYYVVTYDFPQVPRFFRGTPDRSFYKQPLGGRGGRNRGPFNGPGGGFGPPFPPPGPPGNGNW